MVDITVRAHISDESLTAITRVVQPGGVIYIATDWDDYADWARHNIVRHDQWSLASDPLAEDRPTTRFEQRAHVAGRQITEIVARRSS